MGQEQTKRLIELYEKGVLTKEEAKACFLTLEDEVVFVEEEKEKIPFRFPSFKVFTSTKQKQDYTFADIESLSICISEGSIQFSKGKSEHLKLQLTYPQQLEKPSLSNISLEQDRLSIEITMPCQVLVQLPEQRTMSVLDLKLGSADARLDYLPFEDISIRSQSDKKQQDVRLTSIGEFSQWMCVQLRHAQLQVHVPKEQGVKGRMDSVQGKVRINRKQKETPYFCERKGEKLLNLQIQTEDGSLIMKGVKDVWNL